MCIRRKKSVGSTNEKIRTKSTKSAAGSTPTSQTPKQQGAHAEKQREKPKEKEDKKEVDMGENILAKPVDNAPMKEEKQKEPLHIEVPPPRILKAKRTMKEVRSARDPEYRTLELDMSEWESGKIMKRSEVNLEDLKKEPKTLQPTQMY
ncbi:hypothetical protein RB195_015555 [Necator americanus]|uniref:Uncharacterized protein n=1 Tax=Necator americanus TaxID=51031 RepID=A0ABR1E541_NECAM